MSDEMTEAPFGYIDLYADAMHDLVNVDRLEAAMLEKPQIHIEPVHRFTPGMYSREITIPRGCLLTGKIHRTQHLNIISAGRIRVYSGTDPEEVPFEISAPYSFIGEPGSRRVGFALEDTVWTTVHATNETDLDKLEAELIEPHVNPLLPSPTEAPCLG